MTASIQNAKASQDKDRKHILNSLVDRKAANLNFEPLQMHDNYDKLNDALQSAVLSFQAALNLYVREGRKDTGTVH